jgi:hypothetical protein
MSAGVSPNLMHLRAFQLSACIRLENSDRTRVVDQLDDWQIQLLVKQPATFLL